MHVKLFTLLILFFATSPVTAGKKPKKRVQVALKMTILTSAGKNQKQSPKKKEDSGTHALFEYLETLGFDDIEENPAKLPQ